MPIETRRPPHPAKPVRVPFTYTSPSPTPTTFTVHAAPNTQRIHTPPIPRRRTTSPSPSPAGAPKLSFRLRVSAGETDYHSLNPTLSRLSLHSLQTDSPRCFRSFLALLPSTNQPTFFSTSTLRRLSHSSLLPFLC